MVSPPGEVRPAWKVLRVLGNLLDLEGFDYDSSEQVRAEIISDKEEFAQNLNNSLGVLSIKDLGQKNGKIERIGEIPIYQADPIVRRAMSLQKTHDAAPPAAFASSALLSKVGILAGEVIRISQQDEEIHLMISADDNLPDDCIRLACAYPQTSKLGAMFGEIKLAK